MDSISYRKMHSWFNKSFEEYYNNVPIDFRESLWMYMAYGIEPGSFGLAVLTNDFVGSVVRAHRMLTADTFRDIAGWLDAFAPRQSWGNKENIEYWMKLTSVERRDIMIEYRLRPSVIDILKGVAVP